MQFSTCLLNLYDVALREGHLPDEWVLGADNTPRETKNAIMIWCVTWLLCALRETNLWSILLTFLLVGHTHDDLDRFFGRLSVALKGHDYFTVPQMFAIVGKALKSFQIRVDHLHSVWAWKELQGHLPHFGNLRTVHVINLFRRGGIWVKWKQYLTDESWSRPVLLVEASNLSLIHI